IVSRNHCRAMLYRPPKLFEIASANRPVVLLVAKHDSVVVIENDPGIAPAQKMQIKRAKPGCFKQDHQIVVSGTANYTEPLGYAGSTCANSGDFEPGLLIT